MLTATEQWQMQKRLAATFYLNKSSDEHIFYSAAIFPVDWCFPFLTREKSETTGIKETSKPSKPLEPSKPLRLPKALLKALPRLGGRRTFSRQAAASRRWLEGASFDPPGTAQGKGLFTYVRLFLGIHIGQGLHPFEGCHGAAKFV